MTMILFYTVSAISGFFEYLFRLVSSFSIHKLYPYVGMYCTIIIITKSFINIIILSTIIIIIIIYIIHQLSLLIYLIFLLPLINYTHVFF